MEERLLKSVENGLKSRLNVGRLGARSVVVPKRRNDNDAHEVLSLVGDVNREGIEFSEE